MRPVEVAREQSQRPSCWHEHAPRRRSLALCGLPDLQAAEELIDLSLAARAPKCVWLRAGRIQRTN